MTLDQFTYDEYRELLRLVRDRRDNLCVGDARGPLPSRFFIVRHDIDFSPAAALSMAEVEAAEGIRATYFLLLSGDLYNLFSQDWRDVPRKLVALGHEVGLHYDVKAIAKSGSGDPSADLRAEAAALAGLARQPIRSIAMHNPSIYGDDPFAGEPGFVNAYDPRLSREIAYYSDSCGAWRDATVRAFQHPPLPDRIQLLIHPFYWAPEAANRWQRLDAWLQASQDLARQRAEYFRQIWTAHEGVAEHDRRVASGLGRVREVSASPRPRHCTRRRAC